MKTRYKIIVITVIVFIPISIFFPQVFLVFHLDKFEISDECNSLQGQWDWYSNTCNISRIYPDGPTCESLGGRNTCQDLCGEKEFYNPWHYVLPRGCTSVCVSACEFGYNSIVPREYENGGVSVGDFKITEYTPKWKIPEELSKIGCTDTMVIHLKRYSSAFEEKWNNEGIFIQTIGLPWGVNQYALDECMKNISELRNNEN